MASSTAETRSDGFLGGRLRLEQPRRGYRAGMDAVMLAAACPARPGEAVLELGCGAGTAILCLGRRVGGLALSGLELQPAYAELARRNAAANGIALEVVEGDVAALPAALRGRGFDHVIANPPWFTAGPAASDPGRGTARHAVAPLGVWIAAGLRRLHPGGWLTLILDAANLGAALAPLEGVGGEARVLPVAAREGRAAGRVIVAARKGARGPLRLLAPFILHAKPAHERDSEDLTPAAQAVFRDMLPLSLECRGTG